MAQHARRGPRIGIAQRESPDPFPDAIHLLSAQGKKKAQEEEGFGKHEDEEGEGGLGVRVCVGVARGGECDGSPVREENVQDRIRNSTRLTKDALGASAVERSRRVAPD